MGGFSPEDTKTMERRHILEGEQRIARQEALLSKLTEERREHLVQQAIQVLDLFRESLQFSRERLQDLERRYPLET
jgi:hypothetical protein